MFLSNTCVSLSSLQNYISVNFVGICVEYFYFFPSLKYIFSKENYISINFVRISVKYLYFPSISGVSAYWPSLRAQTPNELKLPQRTPYKSSNQKRMVTTLQPDGKGKTAKIMDTVQLEGFQWRLIFFFKYLFASCSEIYGQG